MSWTSPAWAAEVGSRDRSAPADGMSLRCPWHRRRPSLQGKAAEASRCATLIVACRVSEQPQRQIKARCEVWGSNKGIYTVALYFGTLHRWNLKL